MDSTDWGLLMGWLFLLTVQIGFVALLLITVALLVTAGQILRVFEGWW